MTDDLKETLRELGPDYTKMVDQLVSAYAPRQPIAETPRRGRIIGWTVGYLAAASLLVCLGFGIFSRQNAGNVRVYTVKAPNAANEFMLAQLKNEDSLREIIRTQNPDGGWKTDFLTRRNASALASSQLPGAQIAYKRALRNLRVRGLN